MDWAELERQAGEFAAELERWESSPEHQQYLGELERQAAAALADLEQLVVDDLRRHLGE